MSKMGVYAITHIESGKRYIGSSVDIDNRLYHHKWNLDKGSHHSSKLQRAWSKYGEKAFRFHVLDYVEDVEEILVWEQQWIVSSNPFYNTRPNTSSPLGTKHTESSKTKMSLSKRGNKHCVGRVLSEETKDKIRQSRIGKKASEETRRKLSERLKGNIRTLGFKPTEETRARMSVAQRRRFAKNTTDRQPTI